jgi:hypothetical protein
LDSSEKAISLGHMQKMLPNNIHFNPSDIALTSKLIRHLMDEQITTTGIGK